MPDFIFVALLVWLFAAGAFGWVGLLSDGDTGWHIRTGEYILDNLRVPTVDLFSFSKPGEPWFAWEWGSDVIFAALVRFGGLKALVLVCGAVICLTITLIFVRTLRAGVNFFVALLLAGLAAGAASLHYLARPHVFTLLLLCVSIWLLQRDRQSADRWVWLLVPLVAIWTNLHGGFLALIACLGLLVAGSALEALLKTKNASWQRVRRYAFLLAGCSLATLLNPFGYQLHVHVARYLSSDWIRQTIGEFQAPTFRSESTAQYELLLLAGLMTAAYLLSRKRIVEALWILFWAHMSLTSARHIPIFVIIAVPLIGVELSYWLDRWTCAVDRKSIIGILRQVSTDISAGKQSLTIMPILVLVLLPILDHSNRWPSDFPIQKFPVSMVNHHRELLRDSRVLTPDQWGDYLIYRSYPLQKVYVDGRSDFFGPGIGNEYLSLMGGSYDWRQIVEKRKFDVIMIPPSWPLATLLKSSPEWKVAEDDGQAVLYVRRASTVASR